MRSNSLEALGFQPGHDVAHKVLISPTDLPAGAFFDRANNLLDKAGPVVLNEVIPQLEKFDGRWNPGSFMVYPLGVHKELGSLRFHVYPQGMPRETEQGPNTHNHAWHLFSRVLVGDYTDTIYKLENHGLVTDANSKLAEAGLLRLFQTRRNTNGRDVLVTDGTVVKPIPVEDRAVAAGGVHTIEATRVYHLTTIPSEVLAATLVLDSPAFGNTTDVLISSTSPQLAGCDNPLVEISRIRRDIDQTTTVLAKNQLMQAITASKSPRRSG